MAPPDWSDKRPGRQLDRLNNLPDGLIHTILLRLPSAEVVQTSLLSRRWRHTWRSMPFIDIDQREFSTPEKFEDFADALMALRCFSPSVPPLQSFRVYVERLPVGRWIRRVLALSCLMLLDINFGGATKAHLNGWDLWRSIPGCHLAVLHLDGLSLSCHWGQLSSDFPVLEDLRLRRCHLFFIQLESATLKNLTVDDCSVSLHMNSVLELAAPRLVSLCLVHRLRRYREAMIGICVTSANAMPSLTTASVCVVDPRNALSMKDQQVHERGLRFLKSLRNLLLGYLTSVTSLELSGIPTVALMAEGEQKEFPTFQNLKTLLLHECYLSNDLQMMRNLLHNALNLEKLAVHRCRISGGSTSTMTQRKRGRAGPKETPATAAGHKVTEIECGHGDVRRLADDLLKVSKGQTEEGSVSVVFTMPKKRLKRVSLCNGVLDSF